MTFFKKNSYDIVKLYINQIGITIFSLILYFPVGSILDTELFNNLQILISVFSHIFYLFLIYSVIWDIGARDKIRVDGGKMAPDRFKGLKMSLYSNIPNFVIALLSVSLLCLHNFGGGSAVESAISIVFLILKFHGAIFMGFINGITPLYTEIGPEYFTDALVESAIYLVLPIITLLVAHISYYLGSKDYKIFGFISNNKKKK